MEKKQEEQTVLRMTPEVAAAALADRCREDDELSERLREDPKAAISRLSGKALPDSTKIVVHCNDPGIWHIAIPTEEQARRFSEAHEGSNEGDSLTDEQLQAISGGEIWIGVLIAAVAVGVGGAVAGVGAGVYVSQTQ